MTHKNMLHAFLPAIALTFLLPGAAHAQWPGIPDGWSDGYVYANGIRIHYYQAVPQPDKPVIVMAHGGSDIGLNWTTLTWELEDDFNIYMVDARGHGLTDPPSPSDDRDAMVKDLVGFIETMDIEDPIIMGHSMGAGTAMNIGADYPDLARAIILLDPGLRPRNPAPPPQSDDSEAEAPAPSQGPPNRTTPEQLVERNNTSFDDLMAECRSGTPKWSEVDCEYWALSKKQYHATYSGGNRGLGGNTRSTQATLSMIRVPTLVLKADASPEDRAADQEVVREMENVSVVHIDGAGHNLHHDELEATVDVMTEFLSSL